MKEFCRYAVWDCTTGVMLVCGEKYKVNSGLEYEESFRGLAKRLKKISAFYRYEVIKGRNVKIVYWYNTLKHKPYRTITDAGLVLNLR